MGEPFSNPTKYDLEKARKIYGDPLIFAMTNALIKGFNDFKGKKMIDTSKKEYYMKSRSIIMNFGFDVALNLLLNASVDITNDDYSKFEIPKNFEKKDMPFDPTVFNIKGVKITDIAKKYGLKLRGKKCVCPFHDDHDPSLTFSDTKNVFHCFGCGIKGDIVKFVQLMENLDG